jgi:hypothetical protein
MIIYIIKLRAIKLIIYYHNGWGLLEKFTVAQAVKKFPSFMEPIGLSIMFTKAITF